MRTLSLPRWIVPVFFVAVFSGCVSSGNSNTNVLLDRDYHRMSDPELIAYEQELSDELTRTSGSSSGDVSIGLGFGSWSGGSGGGYGVRTDRRIDGGSGYDASVLLLDRRDAVRSEMQRRGLIAPKQ